MMKKRILFVLPTIRSGGGVISGLRNMLSFIPSNKYQIDILPLGYSSCCNVNLDNCSILDNSLLLVATDGIYEHCDTFKHKKLLWLLKVILSIFNYVGLRDIITNCFYRYTARKYSNYDIVVAYQEGATTQFVQYIESPLRIAWIHCDYAKYYKSHNYNSEEIIYDKFHKIVCVSKYTLSNFISIYPKLEKRSCYIYNFLDESILNIYSKEKISDISFDSNIVNIISIGRLCSVKQFDYIPKIIASLLNNNIDSFRWILIGSGNQNIIEHIYKENELYGITDKNFIYLGHKSNPFPYLINSDILVSTSSSEACPFVVNEAKALGVPVLSNNYPSISEFITDKYDGRICTIDKIDKILSELIANRELLISMKNAIISSKYDNLTILNKIIKLFNN